METPLQELIERLEKEAKATKNPAIEVGILRSCKIATELLEKEREDIIEARKNGRESMLSSNSKIAFKTDEQYYNETFKK